MPGMRGSRNCGGCPCFDCGSDNAPDRTQEKRQWRKEWEDEQDFNLRVRRLEVPGWCPIVGNCPDYCNHTGIHC